MKHMVVYPKAGRRWKKMVNHEEFMRKIESLMHGTMTAKLRSDLIGNIVQEWVIDMEEEHNKPFSEI